MDSLNKLSISSSNNSFGAHIDDGQQYIINSKLISLIPENIVTATKISLFPRSWSSYSHTFTGGLMYLTTFASSPFSWKTLSWLEFFDEFGCFAPVPASSILRTSSPIKLYTEKKMNVINM